MYGTKFYTPDFKMVDAGAGEISGYASTYTWDSVKERVVPGAFSNLTEFTRDGFISVGHDWNKLGIASPMEAYEDDNGLFVRAMFHTTPEAQAARTTVKERLERGKSVKLSIGYEVLADEYVPEGRLLKSLKLYEYSLVAVPAQEQAVVLGAKGLPVSGLPLVEHSERVVSAVEEFIRRVKDRSDFRTKEGRVLSAAIRQQLKDLDDQLGAVDHVRQSIRELLSSTEKPDPQKAREVYAEFLRLEALANGVTF